jgi:hypothetical protein
MPSLRSSTCSRDSTSSSSANKKSVVKKIAIAAKNGEGSAVVTAQVRISERLNRAVEAVSQTKNRSPELVPLTADWEITKKKLRLVVSLAKDYADTTRKMNTSRTKFVMHLGLLSEKSPLFDDVGKPLNGASAQTLQTIREDPTTKSTVVAQVKSKNTIRSVKALEQLAATQGIVNEREYNDRVVDYAIEWEKTVLEQVENELKKVKKLQGDRSYYEKKVDTLRQKANNLEEKGKTIPPSQVERLERNETKLKEAFVVHEKEAGRLCVLIEEVTSNGWKDLYHLVKNYCKWESNRVSRETDIYSELSTTIDSMKSTSKINSKKKDL